MSEETLFHAANGGPANFNTGTIKLSVNGQLVNERYNTGGLTLGALVQQIATQKGIKTFSVFADDAKLNTEDVKAPACDFESVDIVAKDARG